MTAGQTVTITVVGFDDRGHRRLTGGDDVSLVLEPPSGKKKGGGQRETHSTPPPTPASICIPATTSTATKVSWTENDQGSYQAVVRLTQAGLWRVRGWVEGQPMGQTGLVEVRPGPPVLRGGRLALTRSYGSRSGTSYIESSASTSATTSVQVEESVRLIVWLHDEYGNDTPPPPTSLNHHLDQKLDQDPSVMRAVTLEVEIRGDSEVVWRREWGGTGAGAGNGMGQAQVGGTRDHGGKAHRRPNTSLAPGWMENDDGGIEVVVPAPRVPGWYRLTARINHRELAGCPRSLSVQPRPIFGGEDFMENHGDHHEDRGRDMDDDVEDGGRGEEERRRPGRRPKNPSTTANEIASLDDDADGAHRPGRGRGPEAGHGIDDVFARWGAIAADAYRYDGDDTGWATEEDDDAGCTAQERYLRAHPEIPVVENMEDMWMLTKLQHERQVEEAEAKRKAEERRRERRERIRAALVRKYGEEVRAPRATDRNDEDDNEIRNI